MDHADRQFMNDNRPFSRMRNLTFAQCLAIVGGGCVLVVGAYFLFSAL
jgi:hypothetical protein